MTNRTRLPFRITLLLLLVLSITVWSAARLYTAIAWRGTLQAYVSPGLLLYAGLTGALWTAAGLFVLWSFWRAVPYSRYAFLVGAGAFAAWAWADRLFVQTGPHTNWLFSLAVTALLLAYVVVVVLDPHTLPYFRKENYERKPKRPTSS